MSRYSNVVRGVISLLVLLGIAIGIPLVLIGATGSPIPHAVPSAEDVFTKLSQPLSDDVIVKVLALVGWISWAQILWSVCSELLSVVGGFAHRTATRSGGYHRLVRPLVLSTVLLFASFTRSASTPALPMPAAIHVVATTPSQAGSPPLDDSKKSVVVTCTVKARDDLWSLAERHLGDPLRWREIFDLNKNRQQLDGRSFTSPDLIRPGWVLTMPSDAIGLESRTQTTQPSSPAIESDVVPDIVGDIEAVDQDALAADEEMSSTQDGWRIHTERLGTLGAGIGAAGIVLMLDRLRRRRQHQRQLGDRFSAPGIEGEFTESLLRRSADLPAAKRLDCALRSLSACLSQRSETTIPGIDAVRVTASAVEVLFSDRVEAPHGPFEVNSDGRSWTIDANVAGVRLDALSSDVVANMPALASVGTTDGAVVLVDLESHPITSIVGDDLTCRALHESMALELATQVWADCVNVAIVGPHGLHANLERVQRFEDVEEAISDITSTHNWMSESLQANGHQTTLEGRTVDGTSEGWVPTVLFCTSDQAERLPSFSGGSGVAVVVLGECSHADRVIEVRHDGVTVSPPGINLDCISFSLNDVRAIDNLLVEASAPAVMPPVPDVITLKPAQENLWSQAAVRVSVLGAPEISGAKQSFDRSRPAELVAYLALHPGGVSADRLKTALWPDRVPTQSTFNSTVSYARNRLGKLPNGEHYVPVVIDGSKYRIDESVQTDVDELRRLIQVSDFASRGDAVYSLRAALTLVRAIPFAEAVGAYEWAHSEGLVTELTALIGDAAHRLAELALASDDLDLSRWAARQGLVASPGFELLYRDLMESYAHEGNRSGVESVMKELRTVLDADDFDDALQVETVTLYKAIASGAYGKVRS